MKSARWFTTFPGTRSNEVCSHKCPLLRLEPGLPPCNREPTVLINKTKHIPFSTENLCSNGLMNLITEEKKKRKKKKTF